MASYEELRSYARIIRNETKSSANTALRIGEMYLSIIDKMEDVDDRVKDFLTGTDTDTIINRWKELESFLNGYTETATLADLLSGKADKATTLAGYGITNAYTKVEVDGKITSVNTSFTTLQTTVSGNTTSINSLQNTVSGHTSSITSINSKITTLQGYFTNGVANFASRLSDGAEYKAWGQTFFKDGKPVNVSGAATFTQVKADSVLLGGKARLSYDSNLNALLLTRDDGTAVHFLASGALSTRGLGEIEEGGGGTGTGVDLLNVPSDIIPNVGGSYSLGTSGKPWKELFVGDIRSENIMPSSHYTYSLGEDENRWSKIYGVDIYATRFTMDGEPVATRNWVNSQSFAKASDLTSINNSISSLQASTFTGANAPEGKGYTLTWFTQSGGGRNVTIPAYGEVGTVATDGLAGIGQNVALVDQWLIADLMDYIAGVAAGVQVDLTSVTSDIIPDGNLTRKLGSSSNRWSLLYVNSINAGTIAPRTDNDWDLGMTTFRWRNLYAVDGHLDSLTIGGETAATQSYVTSQLKSYATTSALSNYVTLNSAQTISGKKTFTGGITASHLYSVEYLDSSALTINAEEVDFTYDGDDSNILVGLINGYKPLTLGNTSFSPALTSGTVIGTITIGGESKTIYAPSGGSADLSNYVTLDGEQTITGGKYFSDLNANSIYLQGFELKPYSPDGRTPDRLMYDGGVLLDEYNYGEYLDDAYIKKSGDTMTGSLTVPNLTVSGNQLDITYGKLLLNRAATNYIWGTGEGGNIAFGLSSVGVTAPQNATLYIKSNSVTPGTRNNTVSLGESSTRWSNVYSVNGNFSGKITSSVADGTAPFVVASTTEVANLHSATATKLHTARTLWGQSFDGSGNVSGNLTEVGSITASNLLILSSTNHDIHIKRGGADTAALYLGTYNFRPFAAANGLLHLGASNARWKVIYGLSLDLSDNATIGGTLELGNVLHAKSTIYTHGKTASTDGKAGNVLGGGFISIVGAEPYINFHYGNSTSATSVIKEISAGTLAFTGTTGNPRKLQLMLDDAVAKFYATDIESHNYGNEAVALQTCFDGQDPETSDYVTQYEGRCNLLLQPRGGQVYVGYTPTDIQSTYSLNVHRKMKLYGSSSDNPEVLFYRDGESSWKVINSGGNLIFQNNYTTAVQSSYFDILKLNYNSGNATLKGSLTTGGNILPSTDKSYSLGATDNRWARIFGQMLNLSGHIYLPNSGMIYAKNASDSDIGLLQFNNINSLLIGQHVAKNGYNTNIYGNNIALCYGTVDSTSNTALYVNSDGNIGIGTIYPSYKLDVNGTFNVSGGATIRGKLYLYDEFVINAHDYVHNINGNADGELVIWPSEYLVIENDTITDYAITCSELVQTSDIRYKNILSNVHLKLSDIAAAPTFKFSWTNETDGSTHIGTSAQYWQEIAGELVVENKKTGKLGLDYSTAALVSAVSIAREVNTMKMWQTTTTDRIEELEDKVKKLEAENKALRELLNNK